MHLCARMMKQYKHSYLRPNASDQKTINLYQETSVEISIPSAFTQELEAQFKKHLVILGLRQAWMKL